MKKICKECNIKYVFCSGCSCKPDTFAKAHGFCCNRCLQSYCLKETNLIAPDISLEGKRNEV